MIAMTGAEPLAAGLQHQTALVRYDAMCRAIAECHSVDEAKDIRDKAVALEVYARQAKNFEAERKAAEIRVRAERHCGLLLKEMPKAAGGRPYQGSYSSDEPRGKTLAELGISYDQSSEWQQLADVPEDEFEAALAEPERPSAIRIINRPHVAYYSGQDEWYTPPHIIATARRAMGSIDCDPASSEAANRIVAAAVFFTIDDDGLSKRWHGNVWLNPPYSQPAIVEFCRAVVEKYKAGEIEQACVLINNATETAWCQALLGQASAVCFPAWRIKFLDAGGNPGSTPLQGQVVVYLGSGVEQFTAAFSDMGHCLFARAPRML
jgi:DNA N-6-adenine-methyltransferase (Dam)